MAGRAYARSLDKIKEAHAALRDANGKALQSPSVVTSANTGLADTLAYENSGSFSGTVSWPASGTACGYPDVQLVL
jgi:hypothetical protein